MSSAGCGHHVFTPFFFALFQGSPLKRETCSRSQCFAPRSDPGPCHTAQQAAGGDRTCPDSAASSRDLPSSSARPARRVLPGQGKLLFVCISQSCHEHRLVLTWWWAPCWAGQELGKGSAEPSWGSHILAGPRWGLFAGPLKRKTPLEKMPWLCLARAGDTKALWAFCPRESKAKEALSCSGIIIGPFKHILAKKYSFCLAVMPVKPCKRAIKAGCHLPAPRGCSVQGMQVLKPPGTAAALVAPGSSSPSNSPSLFLELGLTRALHPSQHHLNNHISAPC